MPISEIFKGVTSAIYYICNGTYETNALYNPYMSRCAYRWL